jgi:16S rRNA (uracil1498-N3)-methyltransferase
VQVLRLQPGDTLALFNGEDELEWPAEDRPHWPQRGRAAHRRAAARGRARAAGRRHPGDRHPANERMDALVEKATELGAAALQPLICERSVVRLAGERAEARQRHWQAVAGLGERAVRPGSRSAHRRADPLRRLAARASASRPSPAGAGC